MFREIPDLWEHHEAAPCTLWKRCWPREPADRGGKESTCTALLSHGAQERPQPAQISPSPEQHSSCSPAHSHHVLYKVTTPRDSSSTSLPRSPGRAVIYKELTPTLSSIDLQGLIRQEDRSALGTAGVRKSGILWPLKGTPSACFCPLPRLLLCIDSNKSFH